MTFFSNGTAAWLNSPKRGRNKRLRKLQTGPPFKNIADRQESSELLAMDSPSQFPQSAGAIRIRETGNMPRFKNIVALKRSSELLESFDHPTNGMWPFGKESRNGLGPFPKRGWAHFPKMPKAIGKVQIRTAPSPPDATLVAAVPPQAELQKLRIATTGTETERNFRKFRIGRIGR